MKKLFGQEGTSDVPSIATVLAKLQTNNPSVEDYEEGQEPSVAEKAGYQIEKEHCIYVRLIDFGQLREAKEAYKQEQWGVTVDKSEGNALSGKIRVRRSEDPNGNVSYELTVKNRAADGRSSIESTVPSTEEQFKQFKYMSDKGMVKHRYVFDAGNGKQWELDVAPNGDGGWYNWARLELEVDDLEAPLPKLPIKVEEVIMPREKSNLSPEEWKEKTDKIMNKYFVKKNAILENDSEEAKQIAQESFDRAEHVISTKHLTGLAVEGFTDELKHFFSFKKKEILGKEKLLESWKNVLKQGNLEGGPSKDKFLGTISSAFDKDEKEIMASFDWEAQLSFMKDKGIDRVSIHKMPMDRLKVLSAELKSHRKAYADNKMEVLKKRITEFNNAATLEEAIKLHINLIESTQDYDDLLKYMDNIIDVFARIDSSSGEEETKAQFDVLKQFDSYKGEAFKREVISHVLKASSIILSRFDVEKVAVEGFFDLFKSKKSDIEKISDFSRYTLNEGKEKEARDILMKLVNQLAPNYWLIPQYENAKKLKLNADELTAIATSDFKKFLAIGDSWNNIQQTQQKKAAQDIKTFENKSQGLKVPELLKLFDSMFDKRIPETTDDLFEFSTDGTVLHDIIIEHFNEVNGKEYDQALRRVDVLDGHHLINMVITDYHVYPDTVTLLIKLLDPKPKGENASNEGFVDSVKGMFKNKYQDKTLNTLVKDMKNFTNEPAPKKLDADIEMILMSYHEYYVTNVKLAARKKLSMNVKRFKELSTNDPKALDAMSNEVLDEAKKADKGYWPIVDKVQKEVEKAHGWDKVNVLIKFLKETNGDKALYKAHGSIMLQAGIDDVADIYDESNKDDITITKVVDVVWNDNNDDYKVAAMDNPKLSKSLTKMCYKLNDIDN